MNVRITPAPLSGTVAAIPSKSEAHRLLICAALADGPTTIALPRTSEDIDTTISCLSAFGARFTRDAGSVKVMPVKRPPDCPLLDCAESGSTLRFMLPVSAALCGGARFTGRGRLPERPIGELMAAMSRHGVEFSAEKLPFQTSGRLKSGVYELAGNVSSQYISGLLMALPLLEGESRLVLTTALESSGYVDMTLAALSCFGISIETKPGEYEISGSQAYTSPGAVNAPGDWSNAAFFLAAGALGGGVTVTGLDMESNQGDRRIAAMLRSFGADVRCENAAVTVLPGELYGCTIDVGEIPDLLPVLAAAAARAKGETRFVNGARERLKESDRLASTEAMLRALGGDVTELDDALVVRGGKLTGGVVDSCGDHRIVMAAAIAAIACSAEVTITRAQAVAKSYPGFFEDYNAIGGKARVV